jgi:hypothetical protein
VIRFFVFWKCGVGLNLENSQSNIGKPLGYSLNHTKKGEFVALLDKTYDDEELLDADVLDSLPDICVEQTLCSKPKIPCRGNYYCYYCIIIYDCLKIFFVIVVSWLNCLKNHKNKL